MFFHFEQKRLFFSGGEIPAFHDAHENIQVTEKSGVQEQTKDLSRQAIDALKDFGQHYIDAYKREPDVAFQYEPQALAVTRKIAAVIVRPAIDLVDEKILSHVDLSTAELTPGVSEAMTAQEILANIQEGKAGREDMYQALFMVGAVVPGGKLFKKAMKFGGGPGEGIVPKAVGQTKKIETHGIPGMMEAGIKPREMRRYLLDEAEKINEIPKLSPENGRKRFDEIFGNTEVILKYIQNADNNPALSAGEKLSAKEALKDEIEKVLIALEESTRGIRTPIQADKLELALTQIEHLTK